MCPSDSHILLSHMRASYSSVYKIQVMSLTLAQWNSQWNSQIHIHLQVHILAITHVVNDWIITYKGVSCNQCMNVQHIEFLFVKACHVFNTWTCTCTYSHSQPYSHVSQTVHTNNTCVLTNQSQVTRKLLALVCKLAAGCHCIYSLPSRAWGLRY